MVRVQGLREELAGIDALIEDAAVEVDTEAFVRLQIRRCAIPVLVRKAEARSMRKTVARLEAELGELEHPAAMRGHVTAPMIKNRKVSSKRRRSR